MAIVIIRPAVADDASGIALVHVRSWQSAYRSVLPQGFLASLDPLARADRWRASLEQETPDEGMALVVEHDKEIIGFVHLCPSRDPEDESSAVGEITSIYLLPQAWGQGIGRLLMSDALRVLREIGYATATLWVLRDNQRAIRMYVSTGWHADGAVKEFVIDDHAYTEVRYRRSLAQPPADSTRTALGTDGPTNHARALAALIIDAGGRGRADRTGPPPRR